MNGSFSLTGFVRRGSRQRTIFILGISGRKEPATFTSRESTVELVLSSAYSWSAQLHDIYIKQVHLLHLQRKNMWEEGARGCSAPSSSAVLCTPFHQHRIVLCCKSLNHQLGMVGKRSSLRCWPGWVPQISNQIEHVWDGPGKQVQWMENSSLNVLDFKVKNITFSKKTNLFTRLKWNWCNPIPALCLVGL